MVKHIQDTNESLYKELKGFAKNLLDRVKNFMRNHEESMSEHSLRLLNRDMKQIAKLYNLAWDEAISGKLKMNEAEQAKAKDLYDRYNGRMSAEQIARLSSAPIEYQEDNRYNNDIEKREGNKNEERIKARSERIRGEIVRLLENNTGWGFKGKTALRVLRGNNTGIISKGQKGYYLFRQALNGTTLINQNGEPQIWMHGSPDDISVFDINKIKSDPKQIGAFFSNRPEIADLYAGKDINKKHIYPAGVFSQRNIVFDMSEFDKDIIKHKDALGFIQYVHEYAIDHPGYRDTIDLFTDEVLRQLKAKYGKNVTDKLYSYIQSNNDIETVTIKKATWDNGTVNDQLIVFDSDRIIPATSEFWAKNEKEINDNINRFSTAPVEETHYGDHERFSQAVTDQEELNFLNNQETIKTYRSMQLIDGKLYPPMAAVVAGSLEDATELGKWEKAVEHPELIKVDEKGKTQFNLNKGKGKGSLYAAYNPYMHSSNLMINDQFSGAWDRPNLVTVECEVPVSELNSGYHAEYAKDNVGWHSWHAGPVAGKLRNTTGTERKVFLSRWIKPVRIISNAEVAQHYAELLNGTDIAVPDNVVTPQLLEELKKAGVKIETTGKVKNNGDTARLSTAQQMDDEYMVLDSENIKSADSITYDDNGNVIPLSERFNESKTDIRWSMADVQPADTDNAKFRAWFKNSKVVNEDGSPLVVYHGTEEDFDAFDPSKSRINMDIQGMFFSPWEIEAGGYGGKVGAYYLSIQNPAPEGLAYQTLNKYKGQNEAGRKAREELIRKGYDGVQTYDEYIAFYPEQIKSATENNGNYDENDPRYRYSTFTEEQADVNQWMMNATASTVQTEDERQLLQAYRDLKIKMNLSLKRQLDYQRKIRELENAADRLTPAERDDLIGLRNKLSIQQKKMAVYENELFEITSQEGYARKIYQFNTMYQDFLAGKTQEQVRQSVEDMMKQVQQAQEQIKKDTEELKKLAQTQAVKTMKSYLGKSSLSKNAALLRKNYNSAMSKAEIEDRMAEIALKQAKGMDITSDCETLAQDLLDKMRGMRTDNPEYIRGTTLVIGQHLMDELKAEHVTLRELRSQLKGSGITLKTDRNSRFVNTWEELRENNQALPEVDGLQESDAIHTIISFVTGEMENSRGANQFNVDFDEAALVVRALSSNVTTYLVDDPKARAQIDSLMKQIDELHKATETATGNLEALEKQMDDVVLAGQKATAYTTSLSMDVNNAIEYYSKTAKVAAENERTKVRKQLIEQLQSEHTKQLLEQQEEFKEKMLHDKKARELAQDNLVLRRRITTVAKRIANLLTKETDLKNIPEQAKPLARQMLRMIVNHDLNFRMVTFGGRAGLESITKTLNILDARDGEFSEQDTAWLIRGEGENADYEIHDKVWKDLQDIEMGLLEYANAEGKGNVSLMDRKNALDRVQKAVSEIWNVIRAQQMVEINGRRMYTDELATGMYDEMANSRFKGNLWLGKGMERARAFVIKGNTTPEYFIKNLHNRVMDMIHGDYHRAENNAGLYFQNAQDAMAQIAEETGFDTWDMKKKTKIRLEKGGEVELNIDQLMQLYVTWKREDTLQKEIGSIAKTFHLTAGGFYVENDQHKIGRREVFNQRAYRMTEEDAQQIGMALTDQQKEFADRVVEYLTRVMGAMGNEASMKMYGIKKYNEQYYFPFEMWNGVKAQKSDTGAGGNMESHRGAHPSFSNRLMNNASNALVIRGFTQTATKHIVNMINYSTFAPAIENLQKVMNTQLLTGEEDNITKRNLWAAFGEAYGKDALDYLKNFQQALNGGADRTENTPYDKLLTVFRKSSVAGSLSVAFQQPLSYIRAGVVINPKYLTAALAKKAGIKGIRETMAEMRKYSGIAVLKKMGKFDMGFGQSARQYIMPDAKKNMGQKAYKKASDLTTALPEVMDTLTWTRLWTAAKLEQQALNRGMDPKSDAFLEKVAERFNEIIRLTQVYDSVMVRSPNMRSKNQWVKGLTSFMAEPTLTLNVLADAVVNANEKGGKAKLAMACAAYILSAIGQAGVKGVMGAGRSPDKKKTFDENFLYRFMSNFINEINPLSLLPGYSDMITLLKKGELSDDATSIIGKFFAAGQKAYSLIGGKSEDLWRDIEDSAGLIAQLFTNIPAKNISRDVRAMFNFFITKPYAQRPDSAGVMKYQTINQLFTADNLLGAINKLTENGIYDTSNKAYYERIYQAQKDGNEQAAQEMKDYVTLTSKAEDPEKALASAMKTLTKSDSGLTNEERVESLREQGMKDSDIASWVMDEYGKGNIDKETAIDLYMKANPKKDQNDAYFAFEQADWEKETGENLTTSDWFRIDDALEKKNDQDYQKAFDELKEHGYKEEEIQDHAATVITNQYRDGLESREETEANLRKYSGKDAETIWWKLDRIDYKSETGQDAGSGQYYRLYDAIDENRSYAISDAVNLMLAHGMEKEKIKKQLSTKYKQAYLDASGPEKTRLMDALTKTYKALGLTADEALKIINGWKPKKTSK